MIDKLTIAAKETIRNNKKGSGIEFTDLWKNVAKKCNLKPDSETISDFYQELIENQDFVKIDNKRWTLRELISCDEFNKISKSLFTSSLDDVEEEGSKEFMSEYEKIEAKHKFRNSDTSSLEVDEYEVEQLNDEDFDEEEDNDDDKE